MSYQRLSNEPPRDYAVHYNDAKGGYCWTYRDATSHAYQKYDDCIAGAWERHECYLRAMLARYRVSHLFHLGREFNRLARVADLQPSAGFPRELERLGAWQPDPDAHTPGYVPSRWRPAQGGRPSLLHREDAARVRPHAGPASNRLALVGAWTKGRGGRR